MNRILLLLIIGALTFFILLLANNPDLFNDVWLYLVGLMGGIVKLFHLLAEKIKSFTKDLSKVSTEKEEAMPSAIGAAKSK